MIRRLHFDHLWLLAVLALFGSFIALVPTSPHDFWWHLRAGQIVATEGIPHTNRFAWTLPADMPYVYATWLGEWLFYMITLIAGLPGVAIARNVMGLVAFGLVGLDARLRSGSWRLAALAVLLAGLMTINNLPIRTQNWAWIPFAGFACLLAAYAAGRVGSLALLALPALMAFWVNAHGTFVLGLVLIALYVFGETLRRLLNQAGALSWQRLVALYVIAAVTLAICMLNPLGTQIFGYVVKLVADQPSQMLVVEWQAPSMDNFPGKIFYGAVLALLAALALARRRASITDVLIICAFLWLALDGQRSVVWFAMLAMPVLAQALAAPGDAPVREAGPVVVNWLIALMLTALVVMVQPPFKQQWPWPAAYVRAFADVPGAPMIFDSTTPVAAAEWLRVHPDSQERLFNEMSYGSYLIWAVPDGHVFIDTRVELFPFKQWQDYIAISDGSKASQLLDQYGVTRVLLSKSAQSGLQRVLDADPTHWRLEYQDTKSAIYRRAAK